MLKRVPWPAVAFAAGSAVVLWQLLHASGMMNRMHPVNAFNLVIHEAGHVVFSGFGETMMYAGGSVLQLLVPLLLAGSFWRQGQPVGAALMLLLTAWNFADVGVYAGDALKRDLPLITDDPDSHDWWNLLAQTGSLRHAARIGLGFQVAALLTWAGGLSLGLLSTWPAPQDPTGDADET